MATPTNTRRVKSIIVLKDWLSLKYNGTLIQWPPNWPASVFQKSNGYIPNQHEFVRLVLTAASHGEYIAHYTLFADEDRAQKPATSIAEEVLFQ